jgi:hypothetical protein
MPARWSAARTTRCCRFTDYDGDTEDDQPTAQGHVGAVAIWQSRRRA